MSTAGWLSTTLPESFPVQVAKSASARMAVTTASAVTGPSVPGVHARGAAIIGNGRGSSTLAVSFSFSQPRPNIPHVSSRTFGTDQSRRRPCAQVAAAFSPGEAVSRGP